MLFTSPREENICSSCIKEFVKKFEPNWNPFFGAQNKETGERSVFNNINELEGVLSLGEPEISNHEYFLIERENWDERLMNAWLDDEKDDSISWKTLDLPFLEKTLIRDGHDLVVGWRENENQLIMSLLTPQHIHRRGPEADLEILDGNNAYISKKDQIVKAIRLYVKKNHHLTDVPFKIAKLQSRIEMSDLEYFCFPNSDPKIRKMPDFASTMHYWHDPTVYARNHFLWKEDLESYIESHKTKLIKKREKIDEELKELENLLKRQKRA